MIIRTVSTGWQKWKIRPSMRITQGLCHWDHGPEPVLILWVDLKCIYITLWFVLRVNDMCLTMSIQVYMPVNNASLHWMAMKVDIRHRHITLFDPDNSMTQSWFQLKNARPLAVLFPYLLMAYGYYDLQPELTQHSTPVQTLFTMSREEDGSFPWQVNR